LTSDFEVDVMDDQEPEEELVKRGLVDVPHPEPDRRWGEYGNFRLVGHGEVTNPNTCGKHVTTKGCLRVEKHNVTILGGKSFDGKVYFRRHPLYCYKSSCPVCYKHGWAVREAGRIESRTKEASKQFGLAEHIVLSVPLRDYHLSFKALRRKTVEVAKKRGVVGGCLIFHGFRYKRHKGWYFSPHFHCIGFVLGGYAECRNCKRKYDCTVKGSYECGGFVARSYKEHKKDGFICKVLGARKTIFGTAWYQLNHSTYDSSVKNFHVATWFGVCSYRKLKVTPEVHKELCPICQSELVDIRYTGSDHEQFSDKREGFADFIEDGVVVWVEKPRRRRKGIAEARLKPSDYVGGKLPKHIKERYEKLDKERETRQFYVCFICGKAIHDVMGMRTLSGGQRVHFDCLNRVKERYGRKEVVC